MQEGKSRAETQREKAVPATWLLLLAVFLLYTACSPGSIRWMGYAQEDTHAAERLAESLTHWLRLQPAPAPLEVTRHGFVELIVKQPFALAAYGLRPASTRLADGVEALEPVLETALIVALIFVWLRRLEVSAWWAWLLATGAGFATILWPYAYMGMEPTQSLRPNR